jgi:hypothetical protein
VCEVLIEIEGKVGRGLRGVFGLVGEFRVEDEMITYFINQAILWSVLKGSFLINLATITNLA